jgi:hypothetical protein
LLPCARLLQVGGQIAGWVPHYLDGLSVVAAGRRHSAGGHSTGRSSDAAPSASQLERQAAVQGQEAASSEFPGPCDHGQMETDAATDADTGRPQHRESAAMWMLSLSALGVEEQLRAALGRALAAGYLAAPWSHYQQPCHAMLEQHGGLKAGVVRSRGVGVGLHSSVPASAVTSSLLVGWPEAWALLRLLSGWRGRAPARALEARARMAQARLGVGQYACCVCVCVSRPGVVSSCALAHKPMSP